MVFVILLAVFLRVYRLSEFPPALHWDEAFDGFDALRLVQTSSHPLFFDGDNGREPLTIYLQAAGLALWGVRDWALRVVSAMLGIATVPALFRLGTTLYAGESRAKVIAALAAGMLAVSFWHVALSRLSMRVISFPLLSTITVLFFWRAWQNRRLVDYGLCGAALGLTLYTYLSARLLPMVLIAFALAAALFSIAPRYFHFAPQEWRRVWLGLGAMLAAMLIVFAPLGIYFLQHPSAFFVRASQISIFSGNAQGFASLPYNALAEIRMFIDRGDLDRLRNLPGEPALNALTAFGFWMGLAIAFARVRSRPAYLFLLLWFGINFVAALFAVDIPSSVRSVGAFPPALLLAADGLLWVWERVLPRVNAVALVMIAVAFGGALTFNNYFNVWGPSRATFETVYGPTRTVVERAISLSRTDDVVLPFSLYRLPSAQFYLASHFSTAQPLQESRNVRSAVWIATGGIERSVLILGKDGSAVVPQPLSDQKVGRLSELLTKGQALVGPFGQTVAVEIRLDNATEFLSPLKPMHPLNINFGDQIKLLGYDLNPSRVAPGGKVQVTYYWQSLIDQEFNYTVVSTLLDAFSNSFGKRLDDPVYETSLWRRGAIVVQSFDLLVPASAHTGSYRLEVGLLSSDAPDQALSMSESEDRVLLEPITVARKEINPNTISNPLGVQMGEPPLITLLGYDLGRSTWKPGERLPLTLYWKSEQRMTTDYSVFLHLLDADGKIQAQLDGPPQDGNAPTSWWQPDDIIADVHELQIPSGIRPGRYTLAIGVYDSLQSPRLPVLQAGKKLGDSLPLQIEIVGP